MKPRQRFYLNIIKDGTKKLIKIQKNGCFDYRYNKNISKYPNTRMQEAVATLAWLYKSNKKFKNNIINGINFWCKTQKQKGYFSEHSKYDQSFAATAFSTQAICYAIDIIGTNEKWKKHIDLAAKYLTENNELILLNQEAATSLSLFYASKILKSKRYKKAAENKLNIVLQSQRDYFPEKKGFDLGYNTLTLYILARIHQLTKKDTILKSAEQFLRYFTRQNFPENSRNTDWLIIGGFEYFSNKCKHGKEALNIILEKYNTNHFPDLRHLCTDLFQICFAYDNVKTNKIPKIFTKNKIKEEPSRILNLIRPLGLHRLRKWRYR